MLETGSEARLASFVESRERLVAWRRQGAEAKTQAGFI